MGQIILNPAELVTAASSWERTAQLQPNGSYTWNTYVSWTNRYNFGTRAFSTNKIPQNAVVTSVALTYNHRRESSTSGVNYSYYRTQFYNTSTQATNAAIKDWLNNNKTSSGFQNLSLSFVIQGDGGRGTIVEPTAPAYKFSVRARIYNIKLVVNYDYIDGVENENITPISGVTFGSHFSPTSLLAGESTTGTYSLTGAGIYGFRVNYRPKGFTDYTTGELIEVTTSADTAIKTNTIGYSNYSTLTQRATQMEVSYVFYTDSGLTANVTTGWINSGVYFLKERARPEITFTVVDTAGNLERYGKPIQNMSTLVYSLTFTPDPYSDATITSKTAKWDTNATETLEEDVYTLAINFSGVSKNLTFSATDSYGLSNSIIIPITSYVYTVPTLTEFKVSRYELVDGSPVFAGSGTSGALTMKATTASIGEQNNCTIKFSDGATQKTIYSATGMQNLNYAQNTSLLSSYTFAENQTYNLTLELTDDFNTVTRFYTLRKSGAPILTIETEGVGFGTMPTGTAQTPTFDCVYPTTITAPVSFTDVSGVNALNFEGTEYTIQYASAASAGAGLITFVEEATTNA